MAKGNMILGYLRGSIGDITFYRSMGQQMARARNRAPANPRTAKQVTQRAKWAAAAKFFSQVGTAFFKYAFEDKQTKESYFNAFMRKNVSYGGLIGAAASKIYTWPSMGLWQISDGKLKEIVAPIPQPVSTATSVAFDVGVVATGSLTTVSELSNALINGAPNRWRNGDILTVLVYAVSPYSGLPTVDTTSQQYSAYSGIWQVVLNTTDTSDLPTLDIYQNGLTFSVFLDTEGLIINCGSAGYSQSRCMYGVVQSRITAQGLLVSPSTMVCPQDPELPLLFTELNTDYYRDVLADWQAAETAVLQGGLSATSNIVRLLSVEEGNEGTTLYPSASGAYNVALSLLNNAPGFIEIRVTSSIALSSSDLVVTDSPSSVIWNILPGDGYYNIYSNQNVEWTAGLISVSIRDLTVLINVVSA